MCINLQGWSSFHMNLSKAGICRVGALALVPLRPGASVHVRVRWGPLPYSHEFYMGYRISGLGRAKGGTSSGLCPAALPPAGHHCELFTPRLVGGYRNELSGTHTSVNLPCRCCN